MIDISLCMIVKDEEDVIGRCLDSVKDIVDEIIIVDTGSTDKTKEIVEKYTDKVYDFKWIEDFAAARNFSSSKASKSYIMWLDADDVILQKDKVGLLKLKKSLSSTIDMVMMKYNVAFDADGKPIHSYFRERIFKRKNNYRWVGEIHEVIVPSGNIIHSEVAITHKKEGHKDPKRNIRIFEKMIKDGKKLGPREQFYYSRELYYNDRYEEAIKGFEDFLDSGEGWIEDCISACKDMSTCYYLIKEDKKALYSLFRSFEFDEPRAEICCDVAKHLFDRAQYKQSIYWYKVALSKDINEIKQGFKFNDCYDFIPSIQLSVCYDRLGDVEKAIFYHEKSKKLKPNNEAVLYNENYYNSLKNKKK
ncbi:glycosyltransferase [Metaclostridioides mangenotii]|uniref:glycosyltransferase n=1 Tax=Metaclostridioides mangenotii TaxID=1540 RepID=UPI000466185E|nr:glycosyltransferase [Clostridioides mangenotii]